MGASSSIANDSIILSEIKLINFKDFLALGTFPRYPENKDITITLDQLTEEKYNKSLIVYISHCWLRGWTGAEGWDGRPHPDSADGGNYKLCADGIDQIRKGLAPGMEECYIWLDYGCIDQDRNPAEELKLLDKIIQLCDCIFTPIYDPHHEGGNHPLSWNIFRDYKSRGWMGNNHSYLNRGWCRLEMFYAANVPLLPDSEERRNRMTAALKHHRQYGRRPHILYGSKEAAKKIAPYVLPPLQNTIFEEFHPEKGHLTREEDRVVIKRLVEELNTLMKPVIIGYEGECDIDGKRHGLGKQRLPSGDYYEGEWKDDKMDGKGVCHFADGSFYDGEWKNDDKDGRGIYRLVNGSVYEGEFREGLMHGVGEFTYPNGDKYNGEYQYGKKHGRGTTTFANGEAYIATWKDDEMC